MGACASAPRELKTDAPAPEPAKDEQVSAVDTNEEVKVAEQGENKVEDVAAEATNDDKKSLGTLLNEKEQEKETGEEKKAVAEDKIEQVKDDKAKELKSEAKTEEVKPEEKVAEAEKKEDN